MSASTATIGLGTKFGYRPLGSAANTAYNYAATVSAIKPCKYSWDKPDATVLASTQKDYVRGLAERESGMTIRRDLGDAAFAAMKTALCDSAVANYDFQILYTDGSAQSFSVMAGRLALLPRTFRCRLHATGPGFGPDGGPHRERHTASCRHGRSACMQAQQQAHTKQCCIGRDSQQS